MTVSSRVPPPDGLAYAPQLERPQQAILSQPEIDAWIAKIVWLWGSTQIVEVRPRENGRGFLLIAELNPTLFLHLRVGCKGVDFCAVWQGEQNVIWDNLVGFCLVWPPIPTQEMADAFNHQMRPIIRRNCFLLGARIEATPEERREWIQWFVEQAEIKCSHQPFRG